ncbi:GNAT family N-acetyltransferase [Salipaludibacillus neizhouensis]|uniref:GNAT family N-acetyltransferase n=2 Tax=Bacillaceae TaxID=186817 RepID=A0A3A9KT80_9BACI|nr:GNAT family N-acetyltransferase [Salipaludibacillus neizhouensis]
MEEQMNSLSDNDHSAPLTQTISLALEKNSNAEFFVVELNDIFVGCAFLNSGISLGKGGPYIWLNDLYVMKEYRQQGIAKKLLLKVLQWAEQEGYKGIELETGISNAATKKLYNSLGFYDIISKRYGRSLS